MYFVILRDEKSNMEKKIDVSQNYLVVYHKIITNCKTDINCIDNDI